MDILNTELLNEKLESGVVPPSLLWSNVKFLNESLKETAAYSDPQNYPFYYHLGKQLTVTKVLQLGVQHGAEYIGPCFLQGCKTVNNWLFYDESATPWNMGFIRSNLKAHMMDGGDATGLVGELVRWERKLKTFEFDMVIVSNCCATSKFNELTEFGWDHLVDEGLLVVDYIAERSSAAMPNLNEAFKKFCRVKNRESDIFKTRNGVGIIRR